MTDGASLEVALYLRKSRPTGNFSIEATTEDLARRLASRLSLGIVRAPYLSSGLLRRLAIAWHAARTRAKLVHVVGDIGFAGLFARRERIVLSVLDCVFLQRSHGLRRWVLKKFWLDLPVARAGAVVTISHAMAEEIRRHVGRPLPELRVIPVAIAAEFRPHAKAFDAEKPRILQLGTAPNKNVRNLATALAGVPAKLVIVGALDLALREQLARDRIDVEQFDRLELPEIIAQYERADLVAFVSDYEGFGMPVIEAQTVGRAVVVGDIAVLRETAGEGACYAKPDDVAAIRAAIDRLIRDAAYRENVIESGFANARRFDPQRIAEMYAELYRKRLALLSGAR